MRVRAILILLLLGFCGCSVLGHLDRLSVLGDYAREKDDQSRLVKSVNAHYDALGDVIARGHIREYKDKSSFVYAFGQPILKKDMPDGSQQWLYRYAILESAKDKVYVYFDQHDQLTKWEKVPCPSFF